MVDFPSFSTVRQAITGGGTDAPSPQPSPTAAPPTTTDAFITGGDPGQKLASFSGTDSSIKDSVKGFVQKLNDYKNRPHPDVPFADTSKKVWAKLNEYEGKVEKWAQDHSSWYKKQAEERETRKAQQEGRTIELDDPPAQ